MVGVLLLAVLHQAPDAGFAELPDAGTPPALELHIHGNLVMPEEVYRAVLHLPPDAAANVDTAIIIHDQLLEFLKRAGYELAQINVTVANGVLDVDIDEGQLEKVVFRGRLTLQTLRFKLALVLPYDVFNRPEIDRQVKKLRQELHLERVWYQLVATSNVEHIGPQVVELPSIEGIELVHPRRRFELHVFFTEHEWDTGAWLDVRSGYPDGLELIGTYQGKNLLIDDDRWRASVSAGGQVRRRIVDVDNSPSGSGDLYPSFSRAFAEIRWYSPTVGWLASRPFLWLRGELISRQRPDLDIENYFNQLADGSLNLQHQFVPGMTVSLGFGWQFRRLFGVEASPYQALHIPSTVQSQLNYNFFRGFAVLRTDLIFDTGSERQDRRHALVGEARYFYGLHDPNFGQANLDYQKVWALGWHDFWLKASGAYLWGPGILFHDEEPIGRHLRAIFGDEYVHRVASATTEFRFSITRDLFKVSIFHDLAAWGHLNREPEPGQPDEVFEIGDSFGAGFHALVEGMFQVDLYGAFGFTGCPGAESYCSNHRFDSGFSVNIQKVF